MKKPLLLFAAIIATCVFCTSQAQAEECTGTKTATYNTEGTSGQMNVSYSFSTNLETGDVKLDLELATAQVGLVAFYIDTENGAPVQTLNSPDGKKFSATITGQQSGAKLTFWIRIAWALTGVSDIPFSFTVGDCGFTPEPKPEYVLIDDLETGDKGWGNVNGWCGVIDNPHPADLNRSAKVLHIVRGAAQTEFWTGAILQAPAEGGYKYAHIKMYRTNGNKPILKVSDNPAADIRPITAIEANKWQDVVFDISQYKTKTDFVMIMADETAVAIGEDLNLYADDILFNNDPEPRVAGPSGMEEELTDNFYITNDNTGVTLHNTNEGWVNIFTTNGQVVSSQRTTGSDLHIDLKSGLYLVKTDLKTTKVLVK